MPEQTFIQTDTEEWLPLQFPGTQFLPLAEPVSQGSVHLLKMNAGSTIPIHTHPSDEYVYVINGVVETSGRSCSAGTFWFAPANTQQGPHLAVTDVEIITIRLGAMGIFGK
jgi:quercetin dioxygenase-like cupin family protein